MKNISKKSVEMYQAHLHLQKLEPHYKLVSKDNDVVKFGFKTFDGNAVIESVLLQEWDRRTACISSQLGCNLGCVFCETGKMGFIRNLRQDEILGQIIGINDYLATQNDKPITNIVFMGMGEALSNFDAFISSLEIIMHNDAFKIGARRITVSTAGVIPSIERLMAQNLTIGLAISLNTYSDELRSEIMPINNKYPIESLVAIAKQYERKTGRTVTFEYVVEALKNDTSEAADALVDLLRGFPCKLNLIPLNPGNNYAGKSPTDNRMYQFCDTLCNRGLTVTIRKSKGRDISGACGQLSGTFSPVNG
jgi:23S rRNA (adenine2503-C2)-methyltransferase